MRIQDASNTPRDVELVVYNNRQVTDTLASADLNYTIRVYQWVPAQQVACDSAALVVGGEDPRAALADLPRRSCRQQARRSRAGAPARARAGICTTTPVSRARFLRARAIATNRLGFAGEALGDLHEARRLLEGGGDHGQEIAEIFRAIATVFSWRGESREAALALLRVVAEARR